MMHKLVNIPYLPWIIIALLIITIGVLIYFLIRLRNKMRSDILETNKVLVEKSENDVSLLFQIETVLEEIVKAQRRSDKNDKGIQQSIDKMKILIEFLVNKHQE